MSEEDVSLDMLCKSQILQRMRVEYDKPIQLHSGGWTKIKYEIERLSDNDLRYLSLGMPKPDVDRIVSIGGGMRFAKILGDVLNIKRVETYDKGDMCYFSDNVLYVDNVMTTGKSLIQLATSVRGGILDNLGNNIAVVIVKRGNTHLPFPLFSFFQVPSDIETDKVK